MRIERREQIIESRIKFISVLMAIIVIFTAISFSTIKADAATVTVLSPTITAKVKGVTPDVLNVRTGPSTSYNAFTTLKEGTAITITGYTAASGGWLKIKTSGISVGYVYAQYVNVPVTGLKANASTVSVTNGKTVTVKMNIVPACATDQKLTWTSSNTAVASVNSNGVVTGKSVGTAIITAKTADGGETATTKVTVNPAPVTGVNLNKTTLSVSIGAVAALSATVAPANAANKAVTWSSGNTSIVTVSSSGVVTGKAVGTATITATTVDGGKTAICKVTVTPIAVTSVSLNKTTLSVSIGESATLSATVAPSNAENKTVTWSSGNSSIATVDFGGVVTGKTVGTATITAKTADGGKAAICKVTVTPIAVTGVSLGKTAFTIDAGSSETLTAIVAPSNATNKAVRWSSSNTVVAMVNSVGVVTGNSAGTATITVNTEDGGKTATANVTVNAITSPIAVTGISLNNTALSLNLGATATLDAIFAPSNATNKAATWSSAKTSVATVDENGVITGKSVGTATITVTSIDGKKSADCTVTVKPISVTSVSVPNTASVDEGKTIALKPIISPSNATNKTFTWTTSNGKIATVSSSGTVAGKAYGTATITVTTADGKKMAVCKVTVNPVLVKFSPAKTGWVTSDALKSRTGPGTNYSAAGTFSKDAKVTVIGEIGEWYKLGNGKYVNAKYITFTKPVDTQSEIDKKAVAKVSGKKAGNVIGDTKAKWYAYSATFNRFSRPQCTWYAKGRVGEVLNYNITYVTPMNGNLWVKNATGAEKWNSNGTKPAKPQKISIKKEYDVSNVKSYSIMSYKNDSSYTSTYGHVVFIEAVERDSKGKPKTIYYTDGGSGYSTQGALKIKTYSGDFQKYCGGGIVGYIQFN